MRTFLYNVSIQLLKVLLPLLARFNQKINHFYQGRKNILAHIQSDLANNKQDVFWVHCSSVGEFEQGLPVIELLKKEHPTWCVVVTFFSPSGYEAINHSIIDYKYYLPYDTKSNASSFIDIIKPQIALFIKYEYWFHFLNQLHSRNIPTYSVSSIFRSSQTFFKWYGGWNRTMLRKFSYFMVQDEPSVKLLNSIGITSISLTGDTRFDRVLKIKEDPIKFSEIIDFINDRQVFLVGSLRHEDDELIFKFIKANPQYVYLIAPHDITEKHIIKIEHELASTIRHSKLTGSNNKNSLIIDSIGKLSRLYRLANFAYIGGGFSDGIHNILEPAVYNIPIFFGNKYYAKYKEAVDLVALKAAFPVADLQELTIAIKKLENPLMLANVSASINNYVKSNEGAVQKVVDVINKQIRK